MLTKKQLELLLFIDGHLKKHGTAPSFEEMKMAVNLKSKSGIHLLVTALKNVDFSAVCHIAHVPWKSPSCRRRITLNSTNLGIEASIPVLLKATLAKSETIAPPNLRRACHYLFMGELPQACQLKRYAMNQTLSVSRPLCWAKGITTRLKSTAIPWLRPVF